MNAVPWVSAVLGVSILLQVLAAVLALRLIPVSRGRAAWYLIAAAVFLMAVRRILPFYKLVFEPAGRLPDPWAESIALVISVLMVAGIYLIRPLFEDRRKAQASLRESEEKLKAIFENAMDGVILVDVTTNRLAACNGAMCRLLGYTAEETRGLDVSEIHPADDLPRVMELYEKQGRKELAVAEEVPVRRRDGTVFSADITSGTAGLGDKKFVVRVFRDITERRRAEEALRAANRKFESLIQASPIGIATLDTGCNLTLWNPALERMFGWTAKEVLGRPLPYIPQEKSAEHAGILAKVMGGEPFDDIELRRTRKDGSPIDVSMSTVAYRDDDGKIMGVLGVIQDISERRRAEETLRESEERYRFLFDNMLDGLAYCRMEYEAGLPADFVYLAVNKAFETLTGLEDVVGKSFTQVIPGARSSDKGLLEICSRVVRTGVPEQLETYVHSLGMWFWTAVYCLVKDHFVVVFDVITERKLAELRLRETTELLSAFVRYSPIYSFIKEVTPTESRVLYASENYEQMVGVKGSDMVGKTMAELFPAEFATKITDDDWAVVSKGEVLTIDEDLSDRNYTTIKAPITLGDRTLLIGHTIDITERKQAEARLAETARRLELAAASSGLGVWDWDITNNRMAWDDRMLELYGITKDTFPARIDAWLDGLHPEDKERAVAECQAAVDGAKEFDTTFRVLHPDGTVKYIKADGLVIRDQDGAAVRMLGLNKDITESKLAEEERARLQEQLLHSQKLESVGRLAGGVAHDFNNMLGVILGHAELALRKLDPTHRLSADLGAIRKAAERSADLTRQLLAFARKQTIAPKVLDLNETVAGALTMLHPLIGEDIQLSWRPAADLWPVNVDPSQIDQILANLCVNARDAIAGVGKITIETGNVALDHDYCARHAGFVPGEYVRLVVSDDGCGMDKETLAHVFEPFFTTKGVGRGTGLGLATVYGIVRQNHGFVHVYSEPGQGTTLAIYLRRHVDKTAETQTEAGAKPRARGQETILLVEDEPAILNVTTEMLETLGYSVVAACTPGEALHLARERAGEIHLLMTDVVMPEMNGRDLAKNLLSLYPNLKRLFMSGYTANVIAHHGVLDEGVHFIQKPFSLTGLAARVREALEA